LATNPARSVKALHVGRTRGRRGTALSLEEFKRFLVAVDLLAADATIPEDVARGLLTLAWTGCRRGEVLALRWSDYVDGELRIERSVWNGQEKATKTDDPRRITVVGPLAKVLEEQRRWLESTEHDGRDSGLIFPSNAMHARAGATRRGSEDVRWFRGGTVFYGPLRKVVAAAAIPEITVHSLRRTSENLLRKAGVDNLVRRAMAGWRTETAQAIYATVDRSERDAAAGAVVRLVLGEGVGA
jgi:integrase